MKTKTKQKSSKVENIVREAVMARMARDGISQLEICRRTGMLQKQVNDYCCGRRDIRSAAAGRIMAALDLQIK